MRIQFGRSCLLATLLATAAAPPIYADVILSIDDEVIHTDSNSQTEMLPVYLDLTGVQDGRALAVGNFQVLVELTGPAVGSEVSIIGVADSESAEHPQAQPLDVVRVLSPSEAQVFTFNFGPSFEIDDLDGLLAVELGVQPFATGEYQLEILAGIGNTELIDPIDFTSQIPFESNGAMISFVAVPEPGSSTIVVMIVAATSFMRGSRRHIRAK